MTQFTFEYFDERDAAIKKLTAAGDIEAHVLLGKFGFIESDLILAGLCFNESLAVSVKSYSMSHEGSEYLYSPGYGVIAVKSERKDELIKVLESNELVMHEKKQNSERRQFGLPPMSQEALDLVSSFDAEFDALFDEEDAPKAAVSFDAKSKVDRVLEANKVDEPVLGSEKNKQSFSQNSSGNTHDWLWPFVLFGGLFLAFKYGFSFEKTYPGVLEKVFLFFIAAILVFFIGKFLLKDGVSALPKQSGTLVKRLFWFVVIISLIGILGDCSGGFGFNIDSIRK